MSDSQEKHLKTPLYDWHLEQGAKMVPFGGYLMPVQYEGIIAEHTHTREQAGLFDVSHMGQLQLIPLDQQTVLERLLPIDLDALAVGQVQYSFLTNEQGGIIDDLMVTRKPEGFFLVVNAGCKEGDLAWMKDHGLEVSLDQGLALLALQGPLAADLLQEMVDEPINLHFMQARELMVANIPCWVSRSGYTGEDGFEISVPVASVVDLANRLVSDPRVAPAGLGARDSLRLEAGLCLYGHDLDATTTPVEAAITWAIAKARRPAGSKAGGFIGAEPIFQQLASGVPRKRVGIRPEGRAPVREGAPLLDGQGNTVGVVTSGGFGPTVGAPVAMGYLAPELSDPGTSLYAQVRGKNLPVKVSSAIHVPHRYYRG